MSGLDAQPALTLVDGRRLDPAADLANLRACFGRTYAAGADVWSREPAMRIAPAELLRALPTPSRILDVGAGRGGDAAAIAEAGHQVVGLDLVASPGWAEQAATVSRLHLVQGDLDAVGADGWFDAVLDNGCLHHQHPRRLPAHLAAISRVLRPDGLFVATVFHAGAETRTHVTDLGRMNREIAPSELTALLHDAALHVERERIVPRADGREYRIVTARRAA